MTVSELIPKKSHHGKSAAYETTPINWAPTIPGVLMILIPGELIALIFFSIMERDFRSLDITRNFNTLCSMAVFLLENIPLSFCNKISGQGENN